MDFHYAYHSNIYYFTIKILVLCKFVSVGACFVWKNSVPCINSSVHNTRINTVNFINFQLRKGGIRSLPIFLNSKNQHLVACFPTVFTSMICVSFSDSQGQKKMFAGNLCSLWCLNQAWKASKSTTMGAVLQMQNDFFEFPGHPKNTT